MTAPERIWAMRYYGKGDEGFWDTTHSPHAKDDAQHEYILHTRAALAASPLVQEIVAEAVKAEREACAQVADDLALDRWREYKDRMSIYCASTHHEGMSDGASDVATAIRARGE